VVLAKTIWDLSARKQKVARIEPVLADDAECALVDGMPVVPRAERHHLPKVSLEPTLSNEQTVGAYLCC
jgi:hypothetical protein